MEDQVDRDRRQEAEQRRPDRRQRDQQPRERGVDEQLARGDHRARAAVHRVRDEVEREQPERQVDEHHGLVLAAQDRDEQVVDRRQEQRVEDEPGLAEEGRGVLAAHRGPAHLRGEAAAVPQLAEVRDERRHAGPVGSVPVVDRLELGLAFPRGRRHALQPPRWSRSVSGRGPGTSAVAPPEGEGQSATADTGGALARAGPDGVRGCGRASSRADEQDHDQHGGEAEADADHRTGVHALAAQPRAAGVGRRVEHRPPGHRPGGAGGSGRARPRSRRCARRPRR